MIKKILLLSAVLSMVAFTAGCFEIKDNVDYPEARFKNVVKKMEAFHAKPAGKRGVAKTVNIMIYVGEERKMIALSTPVESLESMINLAENEGVRKGLGKNVGKKELEAIKSVNLRQLKDKILSLGPCVLVEVEVQEKKEFVHILIWLE